MKESSRLIFLAFIMLALIFSAVYFNNPERNSDAHYEASFTYSESE